MTKKKPKKKLPKLSGLAKKAWDLMSLISRQKDADWKGSVSCITCGKVDHWKNMHAGHFFHASKQSPVTYDHRNIHAQCPGCNTYRGGARDYYAVEIANRYGMNILEELQQLKDQGKPMKRAEITSKIDELTARLKNWKV